MPSEHTDADPTTPLIVQIKLCATCLSPLTPAPHDQLDPGASLVCPPCRERTTRAAKQLADAALLGTVGVDVRLEDDQFSQSFSPCLIPSSIIPFRPASPTPTSSTDDTNPSFISLAIPSSTLPHIRQPATPLTTPHPLSSVSSNLPGPSTSPIPKDPDPDPLCDITRLRVKSQSQDCLYPGAQFCGSQKSGRSSYEVSVTIVDVDFRLSFLCGYLRIRGLTDDWPELTTYFDAQIIGTRHGFLTDAWGASEAQDMTHWDRFPAFHRIKGEIRGPKLHLREGENRGCVFMRWKERFLVPDHRVRDINGASFAGFYYVCVEYNPRAHAQPSSTCSTDENECTCDTATMSGFYFHQNSEPYQQLSLRHVPRESTGVFEFR